MRFLLSVLAVATIAHATELGEIADVSGAKPADLGLPPAHVLQRGAYVPLIPQKVKRELAMEDVKRTFEEHLKKEVDLQRVSAPMFVDMRSGFNDNLNGVERPARFSPRDFQALTLEVPFSLAKWKRWALAYYEMPEWKGLVTDFRGLRCDDDVDYTHSLYVDQFDWEKRIPPSARTVDTLQDTVRGIYKAVYNTEQETCKKYGIKPILPASIKFCSTDEAIKEYPDATPKERENILCEKYGAVFLMGIGGHKADGRLRHDGRAPDYDDWITPRPDGGTGLNGDLLVWHPVLKHSFELSSMGIRVNAEVMDKQLAICNALDRKEQIWHKMLYDGSIPQSIGGGVGQSRLCQFMLRTAHIGECQYGFYHPKAVAQMKEHSIELLGLGTKADIPLKGI